MKTTLKNKFYYNFRDVKNAVHYAESWSLCKAVRLIVNTNELALDHIRNDLHENS